MRVLVLSNKFPFPENDGSSIAVGSTIRALLSADVNVELLSLNTRKHYKDPESAPKEIKERCRITAIPANTDITPIGALINLFEGSPYHIDRFHTSEMANALSRILQNDPPDIVIYEGLFMAPYLEQVKKESPCSLNVLRAHNIEHKIWERQLEVEKPGLKRFYLKIQVKRLRKFEERISASFDAILPITICDFHFFEKVAPSTDLHVFPCGFDPDHYPFLGSNNAEMFSLASMDWMPNRTGIEWFLDEVWPLILKETPDARVHIAGRAMPEKFLSLVEKGVQIRGEVSSALDLFSNYGIQIVPLLSGSGMRIKIMEGLAYGKVIVSTTIGAEGIDASEADGLFRAENPHTFARKISRLLSGEYDLMNLGRKARERALKIYSNPVIGSGLVEFFRNLNDRSHI